MSETPAQEHVIVDANHIIFVLGIVTLTIVNSLLLLIAGPHQRDALVIINGCLSIFLMADALYRLWRRPNRMHYVTREHGWLTLVGSLPIPFFGIARLIYTRLLVGKLRAPSSEKRAT